MNRNFRQKMMKRSYFFHSLSPFRPVLRGFLCSERFIGFGRLENFPFVGDASFAGGADVIGNVAFVFEGSRDCNIGHGKRHIECFEREGRQV